MWNLTIKQSKTGFSGVIYQESLTIEHEDIFHLVSIVEKMQDCEGAERISFRIEKNVVED